MTSLLTSCHIPHVCWHYKSRFYSYLPQTMINKAINDLRKRVNACVLADGGHFEYMVWVKKIPPCGFLKFFPKQLGIFNQFFIHLLYNYFCTRLQIFIGLLQTLWSGQSSFIQTLTNSIKTPFKIQPVNANTYVPKSGWNASTSIFNFCKYANLSHNNYS